MFQFSTPVCSRPTSSVVVYDLKTFFGVGFPTKNDETEEFKAFLPGKLTKFMIRGNFRVRLSTFEGQKVWSCHLRRVNVRTGSDPFFPTSETSPNTNNGRKRTPKELGGGLLVTGVPSRNLRAMFFNSPGCHV